MDKNIKLTYGITDPNIEFDENFQDQITQETRDGLKVLVLHLYLTYEKRCPDCGYIMNHNGTRMVENKGPKMAKNFAYFSIRKQKFICAKCHHTATAEFNDVNPNDHIVRLVKQEIAMELSENVSQKYIAQAYNVSSITVIRAAKGLFIYNQTNFNYLPKHLAFDDFKSGHFSPSGMSIILMDSSNHRVLDVISDRGSGLHTYFAKYSKQARETVKTITVDLFTPYRHMIHELFPNAEIIADHFHVVVQAYTALNQVRIQVMKQFGSHSREYRQLKKFWKLILKDSNMLNFIDHYSRPNFRHAWLTDKEMVEQMVSLSPQLRDAYNFYQELLQAMHMRDYEYLNQVLNTPYFNLPSQMKKARRTIRRHLSEIKNSFQFNFSNGPVEGINNKIKVIKRTAYGFRNFKNFRLRILIAFKSSFFAKNYERKATELLNSAA
jgi:transposase